MITKQDTIGTFPYIYFNDIHLIFQAGFNGLLRIFRAKAISAAMSQKVWFHIPLLRYKRPRGAYVIRQIAMHYFLIITVRKLLKYKYIVAMVYFFGLQSIRLD